MEGKKYDGGKARMDLIPSSALIAMAEVFGYGANKYGDYNWKGGIDHSRLYAAAMRHMVAYWGGETLDPESGLNHLHHALANLAMMVDSPEHDNRRYINESVPSNEPGDGEDRPQTLESDDPTGIWLTYRADPCAEKLHNGRSIMPPDPVGPVCSHVWPAG